MNEGIVQADSANSKPDKVIQYRPFLSDQLDQRGHFGRASNVNCIAMNVARFGCRTANGSVVFRTPVRGMNPHR